MKKSYLKIKSFIEKHTTISAIISILILVITAVAMFYSELVYTLALPFAFSIMTFSRIGTFKHGKIPIFMHDKTWDSYRLRYSGEELEIKYKEMSLKRAAIYFFLALVSFAIWVVTETVVFFLK